MISFLKLIRIQNLLIIAFTQYMVRYYVVQPILKVRGYELQLNNYLFFLIVLSTSMIAAAGYIINDYFDFKIDKVNKPERLVIGSGVKRRVAILSHILLNFIALAVGFYVSKVVGVWKLVSIHVFVIAGLWFYSTTFKRQFLLGNLIIALFTFLVPLIVGIYELLPCYKFYAVIGDELNFKDVWKYIFIVSFFAGITTLLREIIKDIEDYDGDKEYGCNTMPIVIGKKYSKIVVISIALATMICLCYIQIFQWKAKDMNAFYYFTVAIQVPFVLLIYMISIAQTKKQFRLAGNTAKTIMLLGICYLFLFANYIFSFIHVI